MITKTLPAEGGDYKRFMSYGTESTNQKQTRRDRFLVHEGVPRRPNELLRRDLAVKCAYRTTRSIDTITADNEAGESSVYLLN